jgi:hypothetical protein
LYPLGILAKSNQKAKPTPGSLNQSTLGHMPLLPLGPEIAGIRKNLIADNLPHPQAYAPIAACM